LLKALGASGARVHKLTPLPTPAAIRRGHGFHFVLPPETFIDVMGVPPRVGPFDEAAGRARVLATDWGRLPVAAPEDLVLLKRTNRIADYEAISNLVRMRVEESAGDPKVLEWALRNSFEAADLSVWASAALAAGRRLPPRSALRPLRRGALRGSDEAVRRPLALEMVEVQSRGRRYWEPVLRDLRRLRETGGLIPEGTPVKTLERLMKHEGLP
jgi:hypothetical protein